MTDMVEKPKPSQARAREVAKRIFGQESAILVTILVVLIVVLSVMTKGHFATLGNVRNILLQSSIRGVAAVGQAFIILTAGIDLSVGGLVVMTTLLGATMLTEMPEYSITGAPVGLGIGIPVMVLAAVGIGVVNGLSVSRLRMPALIVTLAMWQITKGMAYQIGQGRSVRGLPEAVAFFGQGEIAGVPMMVITFIVVAVVAYLVLNYTTFGKSVYAVGGNPVGAYLSGINVPRILLSVYAICGLTAGIAGVMTMSRTMCGSMEVATGLELDSIASVVIGGVSLFGGRGNLIGVVLGVIIIGVINNGMIVLGLDPPLQEVVKGVILISAVAADTMRRR